MNYERESITKSDYAGSIDYAVEKAVVLAVRKTTIEEHQKTLIELASEMKKDGYPVLQIAKITKLSIEEIQKL